MSILKYIPYWLLIIAMPALGAPSPLIQQLKKTEITLGALALDYDKTLKEISKQEPTLTALTQEEAVLQQKNQAQRDLVAEQIRQAYMLNQTAPLKNLLNQDDFSKTNRMLNYQRYIINTRLAALNQVAPPLQLNQPAITTLTNQLNQLKTKQLQQHQELENLQQTRNAILADPKFIRHPNQYNLEKLLTSFNLTPNANLSFKKNMRHFCIRKISPTEGEMEKFDKKTGATLIDATENQDVRAIAKGRVIYADWLEGYGLLLIIDHGQGYVSLYGRNHNLYKTVNTQVKPLRGNSSRWGFQRGESRFSPLVVGANLLRDNIKIPKDQVNAGDIIASVGNTGGYEKPALYFAIRYNKHPIDPARWCKNSNGK